MSVQEKQAPCGGRCEFTIAENGAALQPGGVGKGKKTEKEEGSVGRWTAPSASPDKTHLGRREDPPAGGILAHAPGVTRRCGLHFSCSVRTP